MSGNQKLISLSVNSSIATALFVAVSLPTALFIGEVDAQVTPNIAVLQRFCGIIAFTSTIGFIVSVSIVLTPFLLKKLQQLGVLEDE